MSEDKRIWNGEDISHTAYRAVLDSGDRQKIDEFETKLTAWSMEHLEHWAPDPEKYPALTGSDLSDLRKFIGDATSEAFDQRIGRNVENVAFLEEAIYDKANEIAARKDAAIAELKAQAAWDEERRNKLGSLLESYAHTHRQFYFPGKTEFDTQDTDVRDDIDALWAIRRQIGDLIGIPPLPKDEGQS